MFIMFIAADLNYNWAATCDFQQCSILTWIDSDEPLQPPLKLRNSKWCLASSSTLIEYSSDKQKLGSDCASSHAGLSLCWSHIPQCWKPHVLASLSGAKTAVCLIFNIPLLLTQKTGFRVTSLGYHESLTLWILNDIHHVAGALSVDQDQLARSNSVLSVTVKFCTTWWLVRIAESMQWKWLTLTFCRTTVFLLQTLIVIES